MLLQKSVHVHCGPVNERKPERPEGAGARQIIVMLQPIKPCNAVAMPTVSNCKDFWP